MADDLILRQTVESRLIDNFITNTDKTAASKQTTEYLETRLALLESYWNKVSNRHMDIMMFEKETKDEPYVVDDLFATYEQSYSTAKAILQKRINKTRPSATPTSPRTTSTNTATVDTAAVLPNFPLPKFSGKQLEWETFKALFLSRVKNVQSIAPVVKLQLLLSCLEGTAANRLENLDLIPENFEVAWEILNQRYDNPRIRLSAHMGKILNMPAMARRTSTEINRLLDEVVKARRVMTKLDRPVDRWDDWFVELITSRLDNQTREDWNKSLEGVEGFPTYEQLVTFLENRSRSIETSKPDSAASKPLAPKPSMNTFKPQKTLSSHYSAGEASTSSASKPVIGCSLCQGDHFVSHCSNFEKMDYSQRVEHIKKARLCFNCLRRNHITKKCPSKSRCYHCKRKHHSSIHQEEKPSEEEENLHPSPNELATLTTTVNSTVKSFATGCQNGRRVVLLATAQVVLSSFEGTTTTVRALLDPASEGSFITERVAQILTLHKRRSPISISGLGGDTSATSNYSTELLISSQRDPNFSLSFSAMVLKTLTAVLPSRDCIQQSWSHLEGLELADPSFGTPSKVDCILGADVYPALLLQGLRKGQPYEPIAQLTVFGWVVTGPTTSRPSTEGNQTICGYHMSLSSLHDAVSRLWELDEVPDVPQLTDAEKDCEEHYKRTFRRTPCGRYELALPFSRPIDLGDSLKIATARFLQLEQRLKKEKDVKDAYDTFIDQMLALGDLEEVPDAELDKPSYYMPHHPVYKHVRPINLRVVFNASQITSNGFALNDFLHVGPKLHIDIPRIIILWRFFCFVFSADIIKMFRQFLIREMERNWLRIVWRKSPQEKIQHYRLRTVIYGTACAPFQAIRTLLQLAQDEKNNFPNAAEILKNQIYMDDAMSGADTLEEALCLRDELIGILKSAGMGLDKWSANDPRLLTDLSSTVSEPRSFNEEDTVSTLGLQWNPVQDFFGYKVSLHQEDKRITKRSILSEVARLYDPLGWLAPVTIIGKILLQALWIKGSDWDQPVDEKILKPWQQLREQLPLLENYKIPRWFGTRKTSTWYLHGFADASTRAYAAAVYLVVEVAPGKYQSTLMIAKAKVAPIKTISVPRLELCGTHLLAKLISNLLTYLSHAPARIYCWSDSQVVLAWLKDHPSRWKPFVANRVSDILTILPQASWDHVKTSENPADLATRGSMPASLLQQAVWWTGPSWLVTQWEQWRTGHETFNTVIEERRECLTFLMPSEPKLPQFEAVLQRSSSLKRSLHMLARCLRWKPRGVTEENRFQQPYTAEELTQARLSLYRIVQREHFSAEVKCLENNRPVLSSKNIRRFLPFLDVNGILRIGGRLDNSFLEESEKHPVLIPKESHLAELLIREAHERTLHGGSQLMLSHLLRSVWIIHSRCKLRDLTRNCLNCLRFRAQLQTQQMAALPAVRVTPARPFSSVGLDYAGPFMIRTTKGRGYKAYKGYVVIFVCMVTRAIHIEVVSDLTSQSFIDAFKRFISRRGLSSVIFSDNSTTFHGADAELKRLFAQASNFSKEIATRIAADGTQWKFIPPRAPHFGGLWEAGVKSFKHHLKRVLGSATLTYEEFSTLTTQIEACLNSRPLSALNSNPEEITALTPGHFLIGSALTALPEPYKADEELSGIPRYQRVTQMRDHFWHRWQKEVLRHLQQRNSWLEPNFAIQKDSLVLLTDENLPPTKWPLARVLELHPGADGLCRVITLKTATGVYQRPVAKVIRLPFAHQDITKEKDSATAGGGPST